MAKRHCKGTTKAGKPCGSPPLKGGDFCLAHSPAEKRESVGFIPDNGKGGRKPRPTIPGLMRQAIEDHILVVLTPHFRTLGYEPRLEEVDGHAHIALEPIEGGGAKLFGESRDGVIKVSDNEDLGAQMKAAEALVDRVYGRPKQTTELAGEVQTGGDTIFVVPDDPDWNERVLEKVAEARAAAASGSNGGDPAR